MDLILHDFNLSDIEDKIKDAINEANKDDENVAFRLGYCIGALKGLQTTFECLKEQQKDVIGRTIVTWLPQDIKAEFNSRYNREPTDEEVKDIIDNYLMDMNDKGGDSATEAGWNVIYDALDDWEEDNPQEENDDNGIK